MAPKKKGGKGKKSDDPAKMADKENLKRAETEIIGLQRLLELRSHEAVEARKAERMWREKVDAFSESVEKQKEDALDITSDIIRQYKNMQEQLATRVFELEAETQSLGDELKKRDETIEKLEKTNKEQKAEADREIATLHKRIEDMQLEFADMLRTTLDKMHARLEDMNG